jgi:hypothetical protein
MKMKHKLLLLASVFFMLFFANCGIPTLFNVTTTITRTSYTNTAIEFKVTISDKNDNLEMIENGKAPSLLLAYIVTDLPDINYRSIATEFSKQYQRTPHGIQIDRRFDDRPILESADGDLKLFVFSGPQLEKPLYHATAKNPMSPNETFKISLESNPDESFNLKLTSIDSTYNVKVTSLVRYNGSNFEAPGLKDDLDYIVPETNLDRHCHIFAAINVGEGTFTNIYWSDLTYLGSLALKII